MMLNESFVLKLKSSCDIYSVFSSYVELKVCGANMRCCCPFHAEKTPSCFVYGATQSFYCFGCGVGGDIITFIEKIENLPYVEAIRFLAEKVGMKVPNLEQGSSQNVDSSASIKRNRLLQINRVAALFFHKNLFSEQGKPGLSYLKARGLNKASIVRFGLGFAPNSWNGLLNHLKLQGFSMSEIEGSGLGIRSKSGGFCDKFRGRVMFPIVGLKGEVLGFGGRLTGSGSGPKYLNSADSAVFRKGFLLYGLNMVKKAYINSAGNKVVNVNAKVQSLILCEGYMDVISLHQNGFSNAVATLGTALTQQQVLLISRNAFEVFVAYDSDQAGVKATARACEMFDEINFKVRVLNLNDAKDPDEFLKSKGSVRFKTLLSEATSFEQTLFERAKLNFKLSSAASKRAQIHSLCKVVSKMADVLRREVYINRICAEFGLTKSVVAGHVNYLIKQSRKKSARKSLQFKVPSSSDVVEGRRFDEGRCFDGGRRFDGGQSFAKGRNSFDEAYGEKSAASFKSLRAQEGLFRLLFNHPNFFEKMKNFNFDLISSSFFRKIFEFLKSGFEKGCFPAFSSFREILNNAEFGYLSKILNKNENYEACGVDEAFAAYIKILNSEFEKKSENVLKMSLSELELKRQKNAKLKF